MDNNHLKVILTEAFALLNKEADYAVLRNYENLPDKVSRDIDIIIEKKSFISIRKALVKILRDNGFYLFQYYKGSEMHSMVFANASDKPILISFDFLFSIYVKDVQLYSARDILANKEFNGFLYHVRIDDEFLSKYIYNLILGEIYPEKYKNIKERALSEYSDEITRKLASLGINQNSDHANLSKIRFKNYAKRPFAQFSTSSRYLYCTLSNLFASRGVSIGFTGPDGVGKTTIIDSIIENLHQIYKIIPLYHFRPLLIGNLSDVAHSAGIKKNVDKNYSEPHRGKKTNVLSSVLRLSYYTCDYIIGYYALVKSKLFKRWPVIFDRYYSDIICDSRRSRIFLSPKFLNLWRHLFIPRLDYNILLTASPETILSRKQELDREGIDAINSKIDYLANKKGYCKILNDSTPDETIEQIFTHILKEQDKRNSKRI